MTRLTEQVRDAYEAFAQDPGTLWAHLDDDAVFHVSGNHPLSGRYAGIPAIRRYLAMVRRVTGGRGGFKVTSVVFADESGEVVLVEGTAFHGEGPFVRTVVHCLRLREGKVVELRDHPFDQPTEDRFWSARMPAQRVGAESSGVGSAATVPSQPDLGIGPLGDDP